MSNEFEETAEVMPALMTLEALLGDGLESLPRRVRLALENDDYSEALAAANADYARKGAKDRDAALTYAVLLVGRQLCEEARGILRRALTYHAQDVALQLAQAEALVVDGEFESALALLEALREVSTARPRHWAFMGDMYLDMGNEEEAIECYRQALERGATSIDVAYRLGHLLFDREEVEEASVYLGMAARMGANNAMLWETAAEAYYEADKIEEAIYAFERLLEERPYDERAWLLLGLCHMHFDRYEEAAEAFEEVVDLSPQHRVAWTQLGHVMLAMGRGEDALHAFREALGIKEDDVEALNGAVMAAYEAGDVEAARSWAQQAVELSPENEESQYNLGVILLTLRKGEEAAEVLLRLVESGEGELAKYLGALAVAEMISGDEQMAFEHIGEAERLDVEPQWLAAFAEELLKARGAKEAMAFLDQVTADEPTWRAVRAMLGYMCSGLLEDSERAAGYVKEFFEAVSNEPQVVPVMWDFESWEAFAFRLERAFEQVFDTMLGILEGRQELEDLTPFL